MTFLEQLQAGISTHSAQETQALAAQLATEIPLNHTLALHGDLGAGKTTFVSGLALAWNIHRPITSPTYNFFTTYSGSRNLVHLDAYRISSPAQLTNLYLEDLLISPFCWVIEWPENIAPHIPKTAWRLYLNIHQNHSHHIQLKLQ